MILLSVEERYMPAEVTLGSSCKSKVIELGYVYCFRIISKISQATGLRDLDSGCIFEPFSFLEGGCSGNHGKGQFLPLLPSVPCGAMTVIGVSTLPQER